MSLISKWSKWPCSISKVIIVTIFTLKHEHSEVRIADWKLRYLTSAMRQCKINCDIKKWPYTTCTRPLRSDTTDTTDTTNETDPTTTTEPSRINRKPKKEEEKKHVQLYSYNTITLLLSSFEVLLLVCNFSLCSVCSCPSLRVRVCLCRRGCMQQSWCLYLQQHHT